MNQQQIISRLARKGYEPTTTKKAYVIMTRPWAGSYTGQIVFKDGTIKTLKSVDAVRAINHEDINMNTYYTQKQIEALPEKERTALYNERAGKAVARMRNIPKAVEAIIAGNPAKGEPEPAVAKAPKVPGRPKEGTVSNTIWTLAEAMNNAGKSRADVVAACVEQGINSATAKTQYQRWSKFNESNKTA